MRPWFDLGKHPYEGGAYEEGAYEEGAYEEGAFEEGAFEEGAYQDQRMASAVKSSLYRLRTMKPVYILDGVLAEVLFSSMFTTA